jgi:hypothetical protein
VKIKLTILTVILSIFLFQIYEIGNAESEIPYVFKYSLSTRNMNYQNQVIFNHSRHAMDYKITCVNCHHQLEAGAGAVNETCRDCHGRKTIRINQQNRLVPGEKRAQPYLIVLHKICVECHKEVKASTSYSTVPVACWRCHIREKKSGFN